MNNSAVSYLIVALLSAILVMSILTYVEVRHTPTAQLSPSANTQARTGKEDVSRTVAPPAIRADERPLTIEEVQKAKAAATSPRVNLVMLDRETIRKKLDDDYARASKAKAITTVSDPDGKARGITAQDIESYPSVRELGIKNGDILFSINNEAVNSEKDLIEILSKYKGSSMFRLGIERNGQRVYLTYRVQ